LRERTRTWKNAAVVKILALVPEAHGGFGGIATYSRDLIDACCELTRVTHVELVPRIIRSEPVGLPAKAEMLSAAAGGLARYMREVARAATRRADAILCSHVHLLPFARLSTFGRRIPIIGVLHGIEAWKPTGRLFVDTLSRQCDGLIAVSECTSQRFQRWSGLADRQIEILPPAVHRDAYRSGPKMQYLLDRYGIAGRRVILTLGRLDAGERQKGVDELIELMPQLRSEVPDLVYLIAGDGGDRARLQAKVTAAGLNGSVQLIGRIAEAEKADHFRLCDVYSMAGRQEGFGIVFLEALATGAPVVASVLDGSRNAVLEGRLGELANPDDPASLRAAILRALAKPRVVPELLEHFSFANFVQRLDGILDRFAPMPQAQPCPS
jgi:glycosyltransferase involved in cell wall biosynthesis